MNEDKPLRERTSLSADERYDLAVRVQEYASRMLLTAQAIDNYESAGAWSSTINGHYDNLLRALYALAYDIPLTTPREWKYFSSPRTPRLTIGIPTDGTPSSLRPSYLERNDTPRMDVFESLRRRYGAQWQKEAKHSEDDANNDQNMDSNV